MLLVAVCIRRYEMRYFYIAISILLLCGVELNAIAAEQRQLATHEHGSGQLNVAIEDNTLSIELSLPAINVVGFEHPAVDESERKQIMQADRLLRDGAGLFMPNPAAQCTLIAAQVESVLLDHAENTAASAAHDTEEHADFDVAYEFSCAEPSQLQTLNISLFKDFTGLRHLRAQLITPDGQTGTELNDENNLLKLR
jgi:hypothetical protein